MPIKQLPLGTPNRNVDPTSLTENLELISNGFMDELNAIQRRPALLEFCDVGTEEAIDGVWWWTLKKIYIVVSGGKTFKITDSYGSFSEITGETLGKQTPIIFAELFDAAVPLLFMSFGGRIAYTDGETVSFIADGNAPTEVTHILSFETFLVANIKGTNSWAFSNANAPLVWTATDTYDAESNPDNIECIYAFAGRLYLIGKKSIETWYNSGQTGDPFLRRISSDIISDGIFAPYVIGTIDQKIVLLNKNRKIIKIEGETSTVISQAYNKVFKDIAFGNDGISFNFSMGGRDFFVISFKSENRTIVYDYTVNAWYEWNSLIAEQSRRFLLNNYSYAQDWNLDLGGDAFTSKIYKISQDYYSDNGSSFVTTIRTGRINYGSDFIVKSSKGLLARFRRGDGIVEDINSESFFRIRYRKDGKLAWSNWKEISLGSIGQTETTVNIFKNRGGRFRNRQFEIEISNNSPFVLSGLWEEVEG